MSIAKRFNAAVKLRRENHLDDCQDSCDRLWREGYQNPWLALLRGNLQLDFGNYVEADKWYSLAWAMAAPNNVVQPEAVNYFPDIALPFAYSQLRLGNWNPFTWSLYELGRIRRSWNPAPNTRPWDGSPEKMLVLSEGGYGDAFLFTRFFQKLDPIQRAASRFVMSPQFAGLNGFRGLWDGMQTVWPDEELNWQSFRFSTALMSLMSYMDVRCPADIPAAEKNSVPPECGFSLGALASLFASASNAEMPYRHGKRFGLCWSAEENGVQKRIRSIDNIADLEPLSRWSFVNLNPCKTLLSAPTVPRLFDADLKNWTDTARVISSLDCVVTVDTAVAHLAGLLGIRAFVILPVATDWKWGISGDKSFWWPGLTLIRNTSPYSFRPAIEKVAELLEKM